MQVVWGDWLGLVLAQVEFGLWEEFNAGNEVFMGQSVLGVVALQGKGMGMERDKQRPSG